VSASLFPASSWAIESFYVLGNHVFCCLALLLFGLIGGRLNGVVDGNGLRCSWVLPPWGFCLVVSAFEKQMPNASWRRWGVATARGGVSPTLGAQRKGRGGLHKRSAEAWGNPLRARRVKHPLAVFALLLLLLFSQSGRGVAGKERPR